MPIATGIKVANPNLRVLALGGDVHLMVAVKVQHRRLHADLGSQIDLGRSLPKSPAIPHRMHEFRQIGRTVQRPPVQRDAVFSGD